MIGHFMVSSFGDVCEPDGYSTGLSKVAMGLIAGRSDESAARVRGILRSYLNHRVTKNEDPRAVVTEDAEAAVKRVISFFKAKGIPIVRSRKANRAHDLELLVPAERSTQHATQIVTILRQFYQLCGTIGVDARTLENPIEQPGWHLKTDDEKREDWLARHPKRPYGWLHAGLRFHAQRRKEYLPLIEDPADCCAMMTKAVVAYKCPRNVIAICLVLGENGCRWREAAWANAHGWSIRGFGEIVYTTDKASDRDLAKKIFLPPDVLSNLIETFEVCPHPRDSTRSYMEHLRELSAAGDVAALRAIPLFPNSRGRRYAHSTFNGHWFLPAIRTWKNEDGSKGLEIRSDTSRRRPTPHWYRHAEITRALKKALAGVTGETDVVDVCKRVCRSFGLKTDQAKRYAAALMQRIADEEQLRRVEERRAEGEARRKKTDVPVAVPRFGISDAEMFFNSLPARAIAA